MSDHENHEEPDFECAECEAEMLTSMRAAGMGGTSYSKAEIRQGFDLKREIRTQRAEAEATHWLTTANWPRLSHGIMLRCSECGELLDAFGWCMNHGVTDAAR